MELSLAVANVCFCVDNNNKKEEKNVGERSHWAIFLSHLCNEQERKDIGVKKLRRVLNGYRLAPILCLRVCVPVCSARASTSTHRSNVSRIQLLFLLALSLFSVLYLFYHDIYTHIYLSLYVLLSIQLVLLLYFIIYSFSLFMSPRSTGCIFFPHFSLYHWVPCPCSRNSNVVLLEECRCVLRSLVLALIVGKHMMLVDPWALCIWSGFMLVCTLSFFSFLSFFLLFGFP